MKKRSLFIITAIITIACAAFTAVSAEATTTVQSDETIQTTAETTDNSGLCADDSQMKKFYFSDSSSFDSTGIVVTYNGIDVTDQSEVTFNETPEIYDGETFDYNIEYNVQYFTKNENDENVAYYSTFSTDVKIGFHGDSNLDFKVNLYDIIEISKKIMYGNCEAGNSFEDFMMNTSDNNNIIDLYDAVWSAKLNMELNPPTIPELTNPVTKPKPKKPDVKNYDTSTMAGIKKYANDCIIYQAGVYGIPKEHITFDDSVDEWNGFSWNTPSTFISNLDYYVSQMGWQPLFYETTAENIGEDLMYQIRSAVREWKMNGVTDERIELYYDFTIKWDNLGHDNYEIYVMW